MKKAIALDIGGTNLRCALINEKYEIEKVLIKNTLTGSLEVFLEEVAKIIEEIGLSKDVVGIAMGVPGKVRWDGFIPELPNIGIKNIPLAEFINEKFHLTTTILNDAAVAALGEAVLGNGEGYETVFFITISTGVGGALVRNKRIIVADDEIGHRTIKYKDNYYEFEKLFSGNGIVRLCKLNGLEVENAYHFFLLKDRKDKLALKIYDVWIKNISSLIQYIKKYFEVDVIVMSGGVIKSSQYFFDDLIKLNPNVTIKIAKNSQNAGLIGASYCALNNYNS